ncbi:MAG TPA: hypothetical protein VIS74_07625 [Chthoniobacterales bacterium]
MDSRLTPPDTKASPNFGVSTKRITPLLGLSGKIDEAARAAAVPGIILQPLVDNPVRAAIFPAWEMAVNPDKYRQDGQVNLAGNSKPLNS